MDYSKIRLNNERNSHVTKRLNRLGAWKFFKVLYRDNMWRVLGFSILMLLCVIPIYLMQMLGSTQLSRINKTLPNLNSFGFSTGVWEGMGEYYAQQAAANNLMYGLLTVAVSLTLFIVFSGGFAVIRDAFWTGKLSAVGVFKSLGKGIMANALYALASVVVLSFGVFGIISFYNWLSQSILWLAIVLTVLLSLLLLILATYLLILCSVTVTYKQSVKDSLDDSWRLLWMNFLPNIIHVMLALIPIPLFFVFGSGMLQILFTVFLFMFGGMYFPLVWQTFMMRTFALFHPVEVRKKKDVQREEMERQAALQRAREESRAARKSAKAAAVKKSAINGSERVETSYALEPAATPEDEAATPDDLYAEASALYEEPESSAEIAESAAISTDEAN